MQVRIVYPGNDGAFCSSCECQVWDAMTTGFMRFSDPQRLGYVIENRVLQSALWETVAEDRGEFSYFILCMCTGSLHK